MSPLLKVSLALPAHVTEEKIVEFEMVFSELLDSVAVSFYRQGTGDWIIDSLFKYQSRLSLADALLEPFFVKHAIEQVPLNIENLAARDWVAENRASFPPLRIGRFWIYGSHIDEQPKANSIPLLLDASLAFGSGTHPTTGGCIRALQMIPATNATRRVLDMGCGSAILAMAAQRLWPAAIVVAADNDPIAIHVTKTNRSRNNIAPSSMRLAVSRGFGNRHVRQLAPYDVIFANILAKPLIRMASSLYRHLARKGWLILSGVLNEQVMSVRNTFRARALRCCYEIRIGDWTTLVMRPVKCRTMPQLWRGQCQDS